MSHPNIIRYHDILHSHNYIDQARLREVGPVVSRDSRTMDNYVVSLVSVLSRNTGCVLFS